MKLAIILFPGTNDDGNTKLAAEAAGIPAEIVRWNQDADFAQYDGFVIPGGWSYEDRVRAGVIAAKEDVMRQVKREAAKGKPVLGICNGAQILVESGLIPGLSDSVEMALAPNANPKIAGYYCAWTWIKPGASCAFIGKEDSVIRIPVAHGEGRFTTCDPELIGKLKSNGQIAFQYCTSDGTIDQSFPTNPNGSVENIAGICNREGNVLAMMPHPERASWQRQVPEAKKTNDPGPGRIIFERMRAYMEARHEN